MNSQPDFRATHALIDVGALRNNIIQINSLLKPGTRICAAVKARAYGHDLRIVVSTYVKTFSPEKLSFAVATVQEGAELRALLKELCPRLYKKFHILLLSLPIPQELPQLLQAELEPLVFDPEFVELLNQQAAAKRKKVQVYLAVDTGMGRIGCRTDNVVQLAKIINSCQAVRLAGMITHFAVSDSLSEANQDYTLKQFDSFISACNAVKEAGINPGIRTCANSAAALVSPEMQLDMVRPGIILYGYYPDEITREYLQQHEISCNLDPVMTFQTAVTFIKRVKKGESVGYGRTWTATEDTDIATIPVGYADGLFRRFSPGLKVAINGQEFPVVGRICMDQCMVNLGLNHSVSRWDTVTIFGSSRHGALQTAQDLADATDTIPYEITCQISGRCPRIKVL